MTFFPPAREEGRTLRWDALDVGLQAPKSGRRLPFSTAGEGVRFLPILGWGIAMRWDAGELPSTTLQAEHGQIGQRTKRRRSAVRKVGTGHPHRVINARTSSTTRASSQISTPWKSQRRPSGPPKRSRLRRSSRSPPVPKHLGKTASKERELHYCQNHDKADDPHRRQYRVRQRRAEETACPFQDDVGQHFTYPLRNSPDDRQNGILS